MFDKMQMIPEQMTKTGTISVVVNILTSVSIVTYTLNLDCFFFHMNINPLITEKKFTCRQHSNIYGISKNLIVVFTEIHKMYVN